jgi:hypothetical protein
MCAHEAPMMSSVGMDPLSQLRARRNPDGGVGSVPGGASEPEATALVALALDDDGARTWLADQVDEDGRVCLVAGAAASDRTALAALAMHPGAEQEAALDHVVTTVANDIDPNASPRGWPWTLGAYGWVEPTAWGVLALRTLRPSATARIDDGLEMLRQRECAGGGWNYGTRTVNGVNLQPYVQTTSVALLGINGRDAAAVARGTRVLRSRWRAEASGLLSLATATVALEVLGDAEAPAAREAVASHRSLGDPEADTASLAWAALALPGHRLEVFTP